MLGRLWAGARRRADGGIAWPVARVTTLLVAVVVCGAAALADTALASADATVTVYNGSAVTIRPDQPLPAGGGSSAAITAAGNEYADFQIAVQAGTPADGVSVTPSASGVLTNQDGSTIPMTGTDSDMTIYREVDYNVPEASDTEGGAGEWPDALIPAVDPIYDQTRNAFPVSLEANDVLAVWVDVFVPDGQTPGDYTGSIDVKEGATTIATVPVNLTVRAFSIPATSSLGGAFGWDGNPNAICTAMLAGGAPDCANDPTRPWLYASLFDRVALEDRVSLSDPAPIATNSFPSLANPNQKPVFDQYIRPLLMGTGDVPGVTSPRHLATAQETAFGATAADCDENCLAGWKTFAQADGIDGKFYDYTCDEPPGPSCGWTDEESRISGANSTWPGVPTIVTSDIKNVTSNGTLPDVLAVEAQRLDAYSGTYAGDQRSNYASFLDPANNTPGTAPNQLWLYTSCDSFGCGGYNEDSPELDGWPGYTIDEPAADSRALPWLAYEYGVSGELYYDVSNQLSTKEQNGDILTPWNGATLAFAGGYGDGTLFYPWDATKVGGADPIPIESIRLKRIRDGRQDYEYLKLASAINPTQTESIVEGIFGPPSTAMHSVTADTTEAEFDDARAQLADLISPTLAATCRGVTATVTGTDGPDTLDGSGNSGGDSAVISALGGDDTIDNLGNADQACGDDGYDTFRLYPDAAVAGLNPTIDGGASANMFDLSNQHVPWSVNLASGFPYGPGSGDAFPSGTLSAADVALVNITDITGTPDADTIDGDDQPNYIVGDGGGDTINSAGGNDVVDVRGGGSPDTVDCGDGTGDIVYADPQDHLTNCETVRLPPTCTDQTAYATENTALPLSLSCESNWGATLRYEIQSPPAHGTLSTPDAAGHVTYTPTPGYSGPDQATFVATDLAGSGSPATLHLVVNGPLTVTKVSPNAGTTAGGNTVTITGTDFTPTASVKFGTTAASSVTFVSTTALKAIAPAHAPGQVDIRVGTSAGNSAVSPADRYVFGAPTVTKLSPNAGPTAGGNTVTITGTDFTPTASVKFGTTASGSVTFLSSTVLKAVAPAHAAGQVDIRVGTSAGNSAVAAADRYVFGAPTVTKLSPNAGPTAGGNTVTITGTDFTPTATVKFGATASGSVTFLSSTVLKAVAPAHAAGQVDIRVGTSAGSSPVAVTDHYVFGAPTVTKLSPNAGPTAGGNTVTITGTDFTPTATVKFGATASGSVTFLSSTVLKAVAPAHAAGQVDIRVGTSAGSSPVAATDHYTFDGPPSAPSAANGRTGNTRAALTWGASTAGSSPITGYTATANPGGQHCTTTGALNCTVTGLTNGTTYTFTVVALSAAGSSPASAISNQVVPQAQDSIDDFNCDGTADFMAVKAGTGDLLFYPRELVSGKRDWFPNVPIDVGTGYGASTSTLKYAQMFFGGDLNGDGAPDLVGVTSTGALQLLAGNCTGSVAAPVAMGASVTSPIGVGDFNGDGISDVLDRHADGTLWMLAGTGNGTFVAPQHVDDGWNAFDTIVAAGDMNGDGHPDVIGREPSGALLLYEGTGTGGWNAATVNGGLSLSPSLPMSQDPVLIGAGDFDGDNKIDLAAIDSTGQLSSYAGNGAGDSGTTATRIGGGWQPSDLDEVVR